MPLTSLSRSIAGEVAIVTGAASGIGRATAHLFGDEGARVALIDVNEEPLQRAAKEMADAGYDAKAWTLDLSDGNAIAPVIEEIGEHFGRIDILVNNAGVSVPQPVDGDAYLAAWDKALAVLLTAHVLTVRAALPLLRKSPHGRIVNIASTEALGATRYVSPYSAAKAGVTGLTRSLAVELGAEGITVNCVCPGPIRTGMTAGIPEENKETYAKRRVALRRYGEPEEVAHGTLSLVLPAAQYITGVTFPVDGGLTIRNA
jgi:3-oxoacyl-[acyl-carrier protein] reductase